MIKGLVGSLEEKGAGIALDPGPFHSLDIMA